MPIPPPPPLTPTGLVDELGLLMVAYTLPPIRLDDEEEEARSLFNVALDPGRTFFPRTSPLLPAFFKSLRLEACAEENLRTVPTGSGCCCCDCTTATDARRPARFAEPGRIRVDALDFMDRFRVEFLLDLSS